MGCVFRRIPSRRSLWQILSFLFVCFVLWCVGFQENFYLNQANVRQDVVYKLNVLEQQQLESDFNASDTSHSIDKRIVKELLQSATLNKKGAKTTKDNGTTRDKTRGMFAHRNPPPSTRSLVDHPLFTGYIIRNPDVCGGRSPKPVDLLIYINSAVENYARRSVIRETWAGTKLFHDISVRTVFILGMPAADSDQTDVVTEYAAHGDIIQGRFMDTFRGLTMKAVTALVWVNWHCPQAKYLLKADDDYFVDTFAVIEDLLPKLAGQSMAFMCRCNKHFAIIRDTNIKWHIDQDAMVNQTHWPPFCSGFFAVYTADTIPTLYDASFKVTKYVSVDDAYLFGLLTEGHPNVTFVDIRDKISVNTRPKPEEEIDKGTKFEFSVFEVELPETTRSLWELRLKRLSDWGRDHSLFVKLFGSPGSKRTVIIP